MASKKSDLDRICLTQWTRLRGELTWIYEGRPQLRQGSHLIPGSSAWLLRRGSLELTSLPEPIEADTPRWVFLPSGYGKHKFSDDAEILSLRFHMQWINGAELFDDGHVHSCPANQFPQLEQAALPLLEMVRQNIHSHGIHLLHHELDVITFMHLQSLTYTWLNTYVAARVELGARPLMPGNPDDPALRARKLIDQKPLHAKFDSEQLAVAVGLSVSQLNRLFTAKYGLTPRQYADQHRIEFAKQFLQASNSPVKQLAYRLGFKYTSHFSNWFRRHTGHYPTPFATARRQGIRKLQSST